jgi:hypothetical protein
MAERLLPANCRCPGDPATLFAGFIVEGQPEPEMPLCRVCKKRHWPPSLPVWYCVVGRSVPWLPIAAETAHEPS